MKKVEPAEVYKNLVKLFRYRGTALTTRPLDGEKLTAALNQHEYVLLAGQRSETDVRSAATVYVVLIAPNSKYATKTPDFKKLLKGIRGDSYEAMFVTEQPMTIHINAYLSEYRREHPQQLIETYDYTPFVNEVPIHCDVPPHRIMSPSEVAQLCYDNYTQPDKFERILPDDAAAIWIGLRPGMVCEIIRRSETAGTAIAYRICK